MLPTAQDILTLFAHGILEQERRTEDGKTESVMLLNPHIHRAWEQLSYLCWIQGSIPPLTVPELVAWLHQPPTEWAGGLADIPPYWVEPLMESGAPTAFADSLAEALVGETQPRLALEDKYFRKLHHLCREMGNPQLYTEIRTFLIRNPILDDVLQQIEGNFTWGDTVRPLLRSCYEPVPIACVRSKRIALCPHCGWTLQWKRNEPFCHAGGACGLATEHLQDNLKWVAYQPQMQRTKEGIQRYVVAPEVLLVQLYDNISSHRGVICELFPEFDAYDLRIRWDDGRWAVDFKDHRRAGRLAHKLPTFALYPEWDRAFYVFPDYRATNSYLELFGNRWTGQEGVEYMKMSAFIRLINREIGE